MKTLNSTIVKVIFSEINGNSFCGVNDYLSKAGEISNRVIQVGVNREKRLVKDLEKLNNFDITPIVEKYGKTVAEKAHLELINSLQKVLATEEQKEILRAEKDTTIARSDAQKDAYFVIQEKGLKIHKETLDVYIWGYQVGQKEVLVKGEYKPVKSQAKTLAKREIQKLADVADRKFRLFKAGNFGEIKISGITLPF